MFNTDSIKTKMTAVIDHFKEEMKKVRTGRAHPDMLANVKAEVYGQMSPLNQIANITVQGATMLLVTPYDVANIWYFPLVLLPPTCFSLCQRTHDR